MRGDLLYTQEQRGDDEIVACYKVSTGEPVWRHRDAARFWESNGGAGPRATPTLSNGRVYTFGATGILNALDAAQRRRRVVAQRGVRHRHEDSGLGLRELAAGGRRPRHRRRRPARSPPTTSPPASRAGSARSTAASYSSPQLVTIDGVAQILLLSAAGATSVAPADGTLLWEHAWEGGAIVQPALTADGDVLINAIDMMGGIGMRRLAVAHGPGGWTVEERWTSNGLKPYFNDFVVHKGHAFGFDGSILACIDLAGRQAQVEGRTLRQRPARPVARPGLAAGAVGGGRAGAGQRRPPTSSRSSRGSRRSRARPGTTRCWSATSCWFATARRWPRSGCPSRRPAHGFRPLTLGDSTGHGRTADDRLESACGASRGGPPDRTRRGDASCSGCPRARDRRPATGAAR